MKLLASDYDNTLKCNILNLRINIYYLKKFIEDGNIFLLNTGRPYNSIIKEINKYKIPYHYLSCNDGNILFDSNNNILYLSSLDNIIYEELKKLKKIYKMSINTIKYLENVLEYEIIISKLDKLFLLKLDKIMIKYNMCYKVFNEGEIHIYIYHKDISKSKPIELVSNLENISKNNIYTIGDNINDLEMLRDYNGYAIASAKEEIREIASNSVVSVSCLIRKLRR